MLNFLHLVIAPPASSVLYAGNYDSVLVSLSIVAATLASYAALLVSQRVADSTIATTRRMWIAVGGLCLGVGIWSMHFVGMLAFSLPCSISYDATLTLLSMIPGILASALAITIISRRELSPARLATGGLLIGAGIGAMHYSGMAAMRLNGLIRYDIKLFLLSILVAVALATLALWIKFRLGRMLSYPRGQSQRVYTQGVREPLPGKNVSTLLQTGVTIASAVVMGLAVSGMHYTAMAAAYFIRDDDAAFVTSGIAPTFLAAIVLAATSLIIVMTLVASYVGKPNMLSFGRSYRLIGLLVAGWIGIAWLSVNYYYNRLDDNLYRQESQLATQQAENIAGNINDSIELLKGIARVFSGGDGVRRGLRRFGANAAPSTLAYEERKQRWIQDKVLGELNDSLNIAATHLGADNIFILNAAGDCIAAGNADKPGSPVGTNYADRLYFPQVQAGQQGHQYAVGRTTNVPGLYYAAPVFETGRFLGAVVVKRNITKLAHWTSQVNAFLSDANGVIILAPDKRLELRALPDASVAKLSAENRLLLYKQSAIEPLAITPWGNARFPSAVFIGGKNPPLVLASKILPEGGITIHVSRPLDELVRRDTERVWFFFLLAAAGMLIVAASVVVLYLRESHTRTEDLRKSEERIRMLLDSAAEGICGVDIHGNCTFVNAAFLRILGYRDANEIVGKQLHELIHHSHTDGTPYPAEQCRINQAYRRNERIHVDDEVFWRRDGSAFPVEYWAYPTDRDGQMVGAVATFFDITERKEYEKELLRSNVDLEQFSYAVSHDMRQPLRMISSYLQLLEIGLAGQLDSEKRSYFKNAIEGAKRIDQMLVALLEYSRVGRMGEQPMWIESRAVLDEALQFLQPVIAEAQAKANISGDWPRIFASHDEILRLLQNLIGNAVKYRIAGRTPEITVSSEVVKNEWCLSVTDNGVGIIPDQIKRLFQVFQRLQLRTAYEGTGIGLALCRKIAEHHKGRIWAESAGEGQGSKFCVVLPVPQEKT